MSKTLINCYKAQSFYKFNSTVQFKKFISESQVCPKNEIIKLTKMRENYFHF